MFRILLIAMLVIGVSTSVFAQSWKAKVDPLVEVLTKKHKNLGLVVGVTRDGKAEAQGYGKVVTPKGESKPDGETIFEIGSITKTFTGALIADAIRRKEMTLEAPITSVLPPDLKLKLRSDGTPTVLDFATHRSGLPVQPPFLIFLSKNLDNPYASFDRKLLAEALPKIDLEPASQKSVYSNLATGVLGHCLVHQAKAMSYETLLRDRILLPLKMHDTGEALTGAQKARLATGHDAKGEPTAPWDFASQEACGGLRSTGNDMLKYASAALSTQADPATIAIQSAMKPLRDEGGRKRKIGMFWITMPYGKPEVSITWHNGGTGGFRSIIVLVPEKQLAVVVLASAAIGPEVDKLALDIVSVLLAK
jgi:serine-type D-Ala-D-Ala carboxypeptidase/endopeptidase